jgi:dihydrolipoamide dehydrogenase
MVVGEFTQEVELIVIGGGPGGYGAAFRAAELGVETVIVDKEPSLGGVCLHRGCVPSKTLLHIAEVINAARRASQFGVTFSEPKIGLDDVRAWVEKARNTLGRGLAAQAKKHSIEVLQGEAAFEDARRLNVVGGSVPRIRFRRAIIATGSSPIEHEQLPFRHDRIWTPAQALDLPMIPKHLLVVGCDYMAIEFATIYSALGSRVTLMTDRDGLLPEVDDDLTRPLLRSLKEMLGEVALDTHIASVTLDDEKITLAFAGDNAPKQTAFDAVIVAIGQGANVESLKLEKTGVSRNEHGFITVNDELRTTDPRIFAVGDVTGGPLLADYALAQGRVAGEVIAGWKSGLDMHAVPVAIFSDPQIAWCGITERRAKAEGIPHEIARIPWGASGRAVGMGRTEGLTKLIYDPDAKVVLGVGLVGPHAAEMISEGALAVEMAAELDDIAGTMHPHPTMSELISDAAKLANGK